MVHIRDFLDYIAAMPSRPAERRRPRREPVARRASRDAPSPRRGAASARSISRHDAWPSAEILRPVLFVPPSMPAIDLLVRMQATRTHMALVIDEYGGTDGLVSIEDLVEMVVGDIEDEHDEAEGRLISASRATATSSWPMPARRLDEVSEAIGVDLVAAVGEMAEEIDTLGGLIVTLAGRVPSRGELIAGPGDLEFEVLDADPRRVKRLRIHAAARASAPRCRSPCRRPTAPEPPHRTPPRDSSPSDAAERPRRRSRSRAWPAASSSRAAGAGWARLARRRRRRPGHAALRLPAGARRVADVAVWLIDGAGAARTALAARSGRCA